MGARRNTLADKQPAALAAASRASKPYVLRLDVKDREGRLRAGDLILISQQSSDQAEIGVIRSRDRLVLARQLESGVWSNLANGRPLAGRVEPIGHCVAIVWAHLWNLPWQLMNRRDPAKALSLGATGASWAWAQTIDTTEYLAYVVWVAIVQFHAGAIPA